MSKDTRTALSVSTKPKRIQGQCYTTTDTKPRRSSFIQNKHLALATDCIPLKNTQRLTWQQIATVCAYRNPLSSFHDACKLIRHLWPLSLTSGVSDISTVMLTGITLQSRPPGLLGYCVAPGHCVSGAGDGQFRTSLTTLPFMPCIPCLFPLSVMSR